MAYARERCYFVRRLDLYEDINSPPREMRNGEYYSHALR